MKGVIGRALYSVFLRIVDVLPLHNPWERWTQCIPHRMFGSGSVNDFRWYFEQQSQVSIQNLHELTQWLLGCRHATDQELFGKPDYWQHPVDFERLRAGDCDDHALWAWRKLIELGLEAELVVGQKNVETDGWVGHAWVQATIGSEVMLLDAAVKQESGILIPLNQAKEWLRPHFSVDSRFKQHGFEGYMHTLKERRRAERLARRSRKPAV